MILIPWTDEYRHLAYPTLSILHSDKMTSVNGFWTGLRNNNEGSCKNSECVNRLYWDSDGSIYEEYIPGEKVTMKNGNKCVRYKGPGEGIVDMDCTQRKRYVCEFICDM